MTQPAPNVEQQAAIDARGIAFVSAGAGTGKTRVLVERFAHAVTEGGLDVSSLLVVTFTDKAAAELGARIRARLVELDRHDLARQLDNAAIHTIHSYCRRLLAAHPLEAGIDPRFRVLPAPHARVLQGDAFAKALRVFCAGDDPERWRVVSAYGADRLRGMVIEAYETLRSAGRDLVLEAGPTVDIAERVDELRGAAAALAVDHDATVRQQEAAEVALALVAETTLPERLLTLDENRASGKRADAFEAARKAVLAAAWESLAERDRALLQVLLTAFGEAYAAAKEDEAALDYEDLQIRARDLLRDSAEVREGERRRFRAVMVDEFQDTNRLQTEVLDHLIAGSDCDVLFVGDEFQSIYGFRHADVSVFRERRSASADNLVELTLNYRSRPEVLAPVNELFGAEFGADFRPLVAAAASPPVGVAFELLVTDKQAVAENGGSWRRSEARHVAQRVRELVDAGEATPGEIVLLFAAGPDADIYGDELGAVGLPTLKMTRASYWGQQQVADLLAYLRLLRNRYDDEALLTVLASPFVGVTNDALVLIRDAAQTALWRGIEMGLPPALDGTDERLLRAFLQRYDRLVDLSHRVSLEQLCERILVEHDYDLAVLAQPDGPRRFANLRKLAVLAREYESLRGADLEGFVEFVAAQESLGGRIDDAVSEEEGADAVRLMTIHAAKGLEFKIVVLADTGRERPGVADILCLSDGRFGFKVAHPDTGKRTGPPSYDVVSDAQARAERAEHLRLTYVGMTRAMERLLVAGSVKPGGTSDGTSIGWVLDRLGLVADVEGAEGPLVVERGDAQILLRVDRGRAAVEPLAADESPVVDEGVPQLALFEGAGGPSTPLAPVLHPLPTLAEPPLLWPERLSFSGMSTFERCPYRFYVERAGGLRDAPRAAAPVASGEGALAGNELGDAVHRLLELVAVGSPTPAPPEGLEATVRGWYPAATPSDLTRVRGHVAAFCGSSLARRLGALEGARVEQPFVFEQDGVLLNGRLDVFHSSGAGALVVDFKTNALDGKRPDEVVAEEYASQRDLYALAALRAGATEVEVVYQFLEAPEDLAVARYGPDDIGRLESRLSAAIAAIRVGSFPARPGAFVCADCPALGRVCAGTDSSFPVAAR